VIDSIFRDHQEIKAQQGREDPCYLGFDEKWGGESVGLRKKKSKNEKPRKRLGGYSDCCKLY